MTEETKSQEDQLAAFLAGTIAELGAKQTPHRLALLQLDGKFKKLKVEDDYKDSLLDVIKAYGSDGITVANLHLVFPEHKTLTDAKNYLRGIGLIEESKSKNSLLLKATPKAFEVRTEAA